MRASSDAPTSPKFSNRYWKKKRKQTRNLPSSPTPLINRRARPRKTRTSQFNAKPSPGRGGGVWVLRCAQNYDGTTLFALDVLVHPIHIAQQRGVNQQQHRRCGRRRDQRSDLPVQQGSGGDGQQPELHYHAGGHQKQNGREQNSSLAAQAHLCLRTRGEETVAALFNPDTRQRPLRRPGNRTAALNIERAFVTWTEQRVFSPVIHHSAGQVGADLRIGNQFAVRRADRDAWVGIRRIAEKQRAGLLQRRG